MIGERLNELRKDRRLTQKELGEILNVKHIIAVFSSLCVTKNGLNTRFFNFWMIYEYAAW